MLVSAVPDPTAFDKKYFDALYRIQAEDFLKGIEKNGLLILDSEKRLQTALTTRIKAVPIKYGQRLQILFEELLKNKTQRVVECPVSPHPTPLLELGYNLRTDTEADALIVGDDSLKTLKAARADVIPLSGYRTSTFEKNRGRYEDQFGAIDKLPKATVDELIIRAVRFSKWLRFYDPQIGKGDRTSYYRRGIEYILSLWEKHGFFAGQQSVKIFTCSARRILNSDAAGLKRSKRSQNRAKHQIVVRDLINPVKRRFPSWPVKLHVKNDANRIFHARYLQTEHAIIRVERGFDLFDRTRTGKFQTNFLTLNMAESPHLKECRNLPDADL